ncbi:MAG: thioredoxin [Spirochaetales bacterium]|jgi:thioredoxin|nr:thioredoxin [Spirochaetales bacterium]
MSENLNAKDFQDKIFDYTAGEVQPFKGSRPAIVDFWAEWCRPCRMLGPLLEELAEEYAGRVDIYKVNVDEEQDLAMAMGIQSIPSLLFVSASAPPVMLTGALPKEGLVQAIAQNFGL